MKRRLIQSSYASRRGFTLVELMISIALALLLIYGISQVFKLSGDTVGAQQAVATMTRDSRALQATVTEDFRNSLTDSPLFLISSRIAYGYPGAGTPGFKAGFRNAEEERDAGIGSDPLAGTEINGSKVNGPSITAGTDRAPRLDRMGFFVRNLYRRQTASNQQVSSAVTSTDAYVWYGHTALPNDTNTGATQPFEQYAVDRVLGRSVILLKSSTSSIFTGATSKEDPLRPNSGAPLWPLGFTSVQSDLQKYNAAYQSVKDLAPVSLDEWRITADAAYSATNGFRSWFGPMEDSAPSTGGPVGFWRAWCQPTVTRPIDQVKLAQTAPYLVGHCSQFIVEYAGDYLNQNEDDKNVPGIPTDAAVKMNPKTGELVYGQTDGKIDYIIDTSADGTFDSTGKFTPSNPTPTNPDSWVRRTRWYGMPRDVTGDGAITINDVVPLSDVMGFFEMSMAAPGKPPTERAVAPWEIDLPNVTQATDDTFSNKQGLIAIGLKNNRLPSYASNPNDGMKKYGQQDFGMIDRDPSTGQPSVVLSQAAARKFLYTCAFHNSAPAMIRITMKIEDPSGKLRDGQWYQFVLTR